MSSKNINDKDNENKINNLAKPNQDLHSSLTTEATKIIKKEANKTYNSIKKNIDKTYSGINYTKKKIQNNFLVKKTWWWRRFLIKILSNNPLFKSFVLYLLVIFIFAGFLLIKNTQTLSFYQSKDNNFFYSFFTALSTITSTGIMLHPIPTTYSILGQIVLFILIEFGSLIFSYIVSHVYINFRSNTGNKFSDKFIVQIEKGEKQIDTSISMLKWNILVIGGIQLTFSFILIFCIYYIPGYEPGNTSYGQNFSGFTSQTDIQYHNVALSIWSGIFDSAGAITNAGMTLFGFVNVDIYRNGLGIVIQFILALEFILGGLGFPVFYDIILKIKMHARNAKYNLSLYSKLSLWAVFIITIITTTLAYVFAYTDFHSTSIVLSTNYDSNGKLNTIYSPWGTNPIVSKNWAIFFSMLNTHSAGYDSINLQNLSEGNKWVYIISMFLGCSPSSSSGQIKLVIIISSFYFLIKKLNKNNKFVQLQNSITTAMLWNSFIVLLVGVLISIIASVGFFFCFSGNLFDENHNVLDHLTDSIFLGVSVYSMCGLIPGSIFNQTYYGYLTMLLVIIASQTTLMLSIFVIQRNSYVTDKLRKKRLTELRNDAISKKYSDYLN